MYRLILALAFCLLPATAHAQTVTTDDTPPLTRERLARMSFTKTLTVEETDLQGNAVASRTFVYQMFVRDDGSAATTQPVVSSVKLKAARIHGLDNIVKADPRVKTFEQTDVPAGHEPFVGLTVFHPVTGLPDWQVLSAGVTDKNGRKVPVRIKVTFSNWQRRETSVQVVEQGDVEP